MVGGRSFGRCSSFVLFFFYFCFFFFVLVLVRPEAEVEESQPSGNALFFCFFLVFFFFFLRLLPLVVHLPTSNNSPPPPPQPFISLFLLPFSFFLSFFFWFFSYFVLECWRRFACSSAVSKKREAPRANPRDRDLPRRRLLLPGFFFIIIIFLFSFIFFFFFFFFLPGFRPFVLPRLVGVTGLVDDGDFSLFFSLSTTRLLKKNKKKSRFFCYFPHAQAASRSDFEEQSNGECVVDFFLLFFFLANQSASLNCFQAWWPGGLLFFLKSTRWSSYFLMQSFAFDILCIRGAFPSGFPRGFLRPFLSRSNDAIQRVQVLVCFFRKIKLYRICETIIFVPSRRFGLAVQFFFR